MSLPNPAQETMVLVTGAASGIGRDLVRELAGRGHHLFLVDIDSGALATVADDLRWVRVARAAIERRARDRLAEWAPTPEVS